MGMKPDLIRILNNSVAIRRVLSVAFGLDPQPDKPFLCPFHQDVDMPSAVLYEDTNVVYCFAEQRRYTVYDALRAAGKDDSEISSYVVNNLGGEHLQLQLRTLLKVEDFDQQIGTHLEGTSARFRRGEVPWVDVMAEVDGYFCRTLTLTLIR